jgi:hypothetical protein
MKKIKVGFLLNSLDVDFYTLKLIDHIKKELKILNQIIKNIIGTHHFNANIDYSVIDYAKKIYSIK